MQSFTGEKLIPFKNGSVLSIQQNSNGLASRLRFVAYFLSQSESNMDYEFEANNGKPFLLNLSDIQNATIVLCNPLRNYNEDVELDE